MITNTYGTAFEHLVLFGDGILTLSIGMILIIKRNKIVNALLESNKVFWNKLGLPYHNKIGGKISRVLILIIGGGFTIAGLLRIVNFLFILSKRY